MKQLSQSKLWEKVNIVLKTRQCKLIDKKKIFVSKTIIRKNERLVA